MNQSVAMLLPVAQVDMNNAKLDIGYRDFCAHLLIPLNECRRAAFYMPWSCGEVRLIDLCAAVTGTLLCW
jgi:NADH dehydrogenase (ubiquinone) 1 beta subcomplex subunit 7